MNKYEEMLELTVELLIDYSSPHLVNKEIEQLQKALKLLSQEKLLIIQIALEKLFPTLTGNLKEHCKQLILEMNELIENE